MKTRIERAASKPGRFALLLAAWVSICPCWLMAAGQWVPLANPAPNNIGLCLLLSNGTVIGRANSNSWLRLMPDQFGSYTNGIWTNDIALMPTNRTLFASDVVPDGRVFVAGGEHPDRTNSNHAAIYDPVSNVWTPIDPPTSLFNPGSPATNFFSDMISMVTTSGSVLMCPITPTVYGGTLLYNPVSNLWSAGPILADNRRAQSECSWAMLPDGSIITVDTGQTSSQRYIPALNAWIPDASLPVFIWNQIGNGNEIGPALTLPNGQVFYAAGTGSNALYTPSGSTNPGTWTAGPVTPNNMESDDTSGAVMVNGKLLFMAATVCTNGGCFPPWHFFEYDYSAGPTGSITEVSAPSGFGGGSGLFIPFMLDLPDGTVLLSGNGPQLWVYVPDGPPPLPSWKPVVQSITEKPDGSFYLAGTGLNGVTEGADEGDDAQMATDYPLVRLTDGGGHVYYARTYNWSSTGIQTGSTHESTYFTLPPNLPYGSYSLVAVANGIASDPVSFYGPVWVDFNYNPAFPQLGTFANPFSTLAQGISAVASGGTIAINGSVQPSTSPETPTITKAMTIISVHGPSSVGQ
jgi:hypothetical protein